MSAPDNSSLRGVRVEMAQRKLEQEPDTSLLELIQLLTDLSAVDTGDRALWKAQGSYHTILLPEAVKPCELPGGDSQQFKQYYLREEGLLIIDLQNNLSGPEDQ